jgi:hypothetical protein
LPARSIDFILHSVAQYLKPEETAALFVQFHRLTKFDGLLVVSDILSPHVGSLTDASALLRFAAPNGFLIAAIAGLARTLMSDYRRLRKSVGLTRYDDAAILEKLRAAGFAAQRAGKNIGHNHARRTMRDGAK